MIRNLGELGLNMQKIITRLISNQNLLKLLYYTNKDPLSESDLTEIQIRDEVFEKLIKIIPKVGGEKTSQSIISIRAAKGIENRENSEFRDITFEVEIFVPMTQWIIKDNNLRPFAIMGEIQKSLNNKSIDGMGKMAGGDFEISFLTEEISCYIQYFELIQYD